MTTPGDRLRARLLDLVLREPGLTVADAARALALDPSTAAYHVRLLARRGRLVVRRHGRCAALLPPALAACPWQGGALAVLREPEALAAAGLLLQGPVFPGRLERALELRRGRASRVLGPWSGPASPSAPAAASRACPTRARRACSARSSASAATARRRAPVSRSAPRRSARRRAAG